MEVSHHPKRSRRGITGYGAYTRRLLYPPPSLSSLNTPLSHGRAPAGDAARSLIRSPHDGSRRARARAARGAGRRCVVATHGGSAPAGRPDRPLCSLRPVPRRPRARGGRFRAGSVPRVAAARRCPRSRGAGRRERRARVAVHALACAGGCAARAGRPAGAAATSSRGRGAATGQGAWAARGEGSVGGGAGVAVVAGGGAAVVAGGGAAVAAGGGAPASACVTASRVTVACILIHSSARRRLASSSSSSRLRFRGAVRPARGRSEGWHGATHAFCVARARLLVRLADGAEGGTVPAHALCVARLPSRPPR